MTDEINYALKKKTPRIFRHKLVVTQQRFLNVIVHSLRYVIDQFCIAPDCCCGGCLGSLLPSKSTQRFPASPFRVSRSSAVSGLVLSTRLAAASVSFCHVIVTISTTTVECMFLQCGSVCLQQQHVYIERDRSLKYEVTHGHCVSAVRPTRSMSGASCCCG